MVVGFLSVDPAVSVASSVAVAEAFLSVVVEVVACASDLASPSALVQAAVAHSSESSAVVVVVAAFLFVVEVVAASTVLAAISAVEVDVDSAVVVVVVVVLEQVQGQVEDQRDSVLE